MGYNPEKHHRRSLRLPHYDYATAGHYFITICTYQRRCLLGSIVDGEMQLNELGNVVRSQWLRLPQCYSHLQLDVFVVMPNHIHGILTLNPQHVPSVGAGSAKIPSSPTQKFTTKPAPGYTPEQSIAGNRSDGDKNSGGSGFERNVQDRTERRSAEPAPTGGGGGGKRHGISEIVRGFKTFSARRVNRLRRVKGVPVWQRNYYEHIVRDETALKNIQRYIQNNPLSWWEDQLHPDCRSKR
ncbi:MAG: transposase [Cyanobacteria bacterium P01_F01_bin.86]